MDLFGTIGEWIDTGVDWVAEAVGYTDDDFIDITGDVYKGLTAGEQLVSDVKSFTDSDTFGFIKKGADYYARSAGLLDDKGKAKTNYFQPPASKRRTQARPVGALTSGSGAMTRAGFTPTKVNTGYNNPDVRSALTSLLNNSYNQQMNNMFASYLVSPTKTSGQRTIGIGTTSVKGVTKKTKTARKSRGLA